MNPDDDEPYTPPLTGEEALWLLANKDARVSRTPNGEQVVQLLTSGLSLQSMKGMLVFSPQRQSRHVPEWRRDRTERYERNGDVTVDEGWETVDSGNVVNVVQALDAPGGPRLRGPRLGLTQLRREHYGLSEFTAVVETLVPEEEPVGWNLALCWSPIGAVVRRLQEQAEAKEDR